MPTYMPEIQICELDKYKCSIWQICSRFKANIPQSVCGNGAASNLMAAEVPGEVDGDHGDDVGDEDDDIVYEDANGA